MALVFYRAEARIRNLKFYFAGRIMEEAEEGFHKMFPGHPVRRLLSLAHMSKKGLAYSMRLRKETGRKKNEDKG